MSTFNGKILEYPFVSIDRFDGENLASSIFFLSHCHKDHIVGILEMDFIETLKKRKSVRLYTSETTRNLMSCDEEMVHLLQFTIGLPIHQQQVISVKHHESKDQNLVVTLLSAGHCVGSVMFLLEGSGGKVLYTGDFRLRAKDISKITQSFCNLESVYIDTTFCCPLVPDFPTRADTTQAIISIIEGWIVKGPNHMVHLKCKGRYGYEYIMKEVAKNFQTKLHVNKWRMKMSAKLPYMLEHFTTTAHHTQIHCCYYGRLSISSSKALPCGLHFIDGRPCKVLTIVPSSLFFIQNGEIPKEGKIWHAKQDIWRVFHSMHASYDEMRRLLQFLKPQNIYPFVPPVDCQDVIVAYNRLQDLQCKENETMMENDKSMIPKKSSSPFREENITWRKGLEKSRKAGHITSPPHMKVETNRLFSPPPARRKKRRSNPSVVNQNNKRTTSSLSNKRLILEDSLSSNEMEKISREATSMNCNDVQLASPPIIVSLDAKCIKPDDASNKRSNQQSSSKKANREPDITFVEEGCQIIKETQELMSGNYQSLRKIPKQDSERKSSGSAISSNPTDVNLGQRALANGEESEKNQSLRQNQIKREAGRSIPITCVENALKEQYDLIKNENISPCRMEKTSQTLEESSQNLDDGNTLDGDYNDSNKETCRSSQIEDSEISRSPTAPKIVDEDYTTHLFENDSQIIEDFSEESQVNFSESTEGYSYDSQVNDTKINKGDSQVIENDAKINEGEGSQVIENDTKINEGEDSQVIENGTKINEGEDSQVIENGTKMNKEDGDRDLNLKTECKLTTQPFTNNSASKTINRAKIFYFEPNRSPTSSSSNQKKEKSLEFGIENSIGIDDDAISSILTKTNVNNSKETSNMERNDSIRNNDVTGNIDVIRENDVIDISSGEEDDKLSEIKDSDDDVDDDDLTLSLSESNDNSMDNSMEMSQVF